MPNHTEPAAKQPQNIDYQAIDATLSQHPITETPLLDETEISRLLSALGIVFDNNQTTEPTNENTSLSISIIRSREFGMVISAGVGGSQAEIYKDSCRTGHSTTSSSTALTDGAEFLSLFKNTIAYKKLALSKQPVVDSELACLFSRLIAFANHYSPTNQNAEFILEHFELNPATIVGGKIKVLAATGQFGLPTPTPAARPIAKIGNMLHPKSIGIIGVSATKMNFGRIILKNVLDSGYDRDNMLIVRPGETDIDGVKCIDGLQALENKLDLFIVAVGADAVFDLVDEIIAANAAESVMLIPGGLGETEASRAQAAEMAAKMNEAHRHGDGGPIFLGGNCLGIVSHPGNYDSWFIPKFKLPKPPKKTQRNSALISQSGAFMITRISQNPWFDPNYMTALGNQNDLTHSDMVNYFADNAEIDLIGVYVEGFKELDGLAFAEAVRKCIVNGKQVVVYKAGQSTPGQAATLGHTASIAGDYEVCQTILRQSGAIFANSFTEFNDLFYVADCMHNKKIYGNRLGAVSGAGFEAVGMADSIHSGDFSLTMGALEPKTHERLAQVLKAKKLDALMEIRNPFDINPGADDEAHVLCTEAFVDDPNIDAVVVGLDPLSPMMRTLLDSPRPGFDINSEDSVTHQLPKLVQDKDKPIIGIVDGGSLYDPMIEMLKDRGVCTFRSCDQGVKALGKYIQARLNSEYIKQKYRNG